MSRQPTTITIEPREAGRTTQRFAVFAGELEQPGVAVVRGPGYWAVLLGRAQRFQRSSKAEALEIVREWCEPRGPR